MEGSETIIASAVRVDPSFELFSLKPPHLFTDISCVSASSIEQGCVLFFFLAQDKLDEDLDCLINVFVRSIMDWCVATLVIKDDLCIRILELR